MASVIEYIKPYFDGQKIEGQSEYLPIWESWYRGYCDDFHRYYIYNGTNQIWKERKQLKMGKKACEDWANLLLNEKCSITIKDTNKLDEILTRCSFWMKANLLLEKSFALSMGALVESVENLTITDKGQVIKTKDARVKIDYLNALKIYPITFKNGEIVECAFASENSNSLNISIHKLVDGKYVIINLEIEHDINGVKKNVVEKVFNTNSEKPLFQIIRPNIANNFDIDSPLGISVFANAIDNLKAIDNAYDSLDNEIEIGRRRIMVDDRLLKVNADGNAIEPFDPKDAAFYRLPARPDGTPILEEFAGQLRINDISLGLQEQLNTFAASVGFGKNYYTFGARGGGRPIQTATGIIAQNSDLFRNLKKHELLLEQALKDMVDRIAFLVNEYTLDTMDASDIVIMFDDSIIEDKDSQKTSDRTDVANGVMSKVEYRMKWYGEDEDTATKNLEKFSLNDLDARLNALIPALENGAISVEAFVDEVYKDKDDAYKSAMVDYITQSQSKSNEPIDISMFGGLGNE